MCPKSAAVLLREHGLRPKKALGQNFLCDVHVAERIAEAASPDPHTHVLEIGAGLGALTRPLLARAERVVAIERDADLADVLSAEFAEVIGEGRLEVHRGDALAMDWLSLVAHDGPITIAGNLPYLITGRLLERMIAVAGRIARAVVMVQGEVADRLVAPAGGEAYGALSVFTQAAFSPKKLLTVKGGAFLPRPEVDSAVVVLTPALAAVEDDAFRAVVKAAFATRRKTLRNAWRGVLGWSDAELGERAARAGIDLGRRGETLGVADFDRIAHGA